MTDPYRDELENVRTRNAQLESENVQLKGEVEALRNHPGHPSQRMLGIPWSFVAFLSVLALGLVAMVSIALAPRPQPSVAIDPQFRGVAIAPAPLAVRAPEPVRPAQPRAAEQCVCAAGDPLCACAPASPWRVIDPPSDARAKGKAFELGASDDPADWQRAREMLESRVFGRRASTAEVRFLKAICKKQGDVTCVDVCKSLETEAPPPRPDHL